VDKIQTVASPVAQAINSTIPPITAPNRLLRKKERKASVCIKMITEKEAAALAYKLYYLLLFDKHCR
jgi:hypothetical protein